MRKKTKIVGLKHRGVTSVFLESLSGKRISLIAEPENKFDQFAVKCTANGTHFGYINKNDSVLFTSLLDKYSINRIEIISFDEYKVDIEVDFDMPEKTEKITNFTLKEIKDGDVPGVYQISFPHPNYGEIACYIGQSININRRLRVHYSELEKNKHHNRVLQDAWNHKSESFQNRIIEKCPQNINELGKQIWLFRKETESIKLSELMTVNRINADLVLTKEAKLKLNGIVKEAILALQVKRKKAVLDKELVGQEIIKFGIMKEEEFWDGKQRGGNSEKRYLSVKASNVFTWLNKTRYGMLEYRPKIDFTNPRYSELKGKIDTAHSKVKKLERKTKYVKEFIFTFQTKGKYETCKIEALEKFLSIVELECDIRLEISKKIIQCPNCAGKIRIPSGKKIKFTCPYCGKVYITKHI